MRPPPTALLAEMCHEKYTELGKGTAPPQACAKMADLWLTPGYVLLATMSPDATAKEQMQVGQLPP